MKGSTTRKSTRKTNRINKSSSYMTWDKFTTNLKVTHDADCKINTNSKCRKSFFLFLNIWIFNKMKMQRKEIRMCLFSAKNYIVLLWFPFILSLMQWHGLENGIFLRCYFFLYFIERWKIKQVQKIRPSLPCMNYWYT